MTTIEDKIAYLYDKKKMSLRQLKDVTKLSHETIRKIVKNKGVLREKKRIKIPPEKIIALYNKLQSYQDVSEKLKLSRQYVFIIVNNGNNIKKSVKRRRPVA